MVEFIIFTDHKPTYAFKQKNEKWSPRQIRHLDLIGQYSTDIRHIFGINNVVADTLSRVEEIVDPLNFELLAESQQQNEKLKTFLQRKSDLKLEKIKIPGTEISIYCDTSRNVLRPYLTKAFRKKTFERLHRISHPRVKTTVKLITKRYVWRSIKADSRKWSQACIDCQKTKISRHVVSAKGSFVSPSKRFRHVHLDIVKMPYCCGKRYCLTCIDRFSRWPEVFPIENQEAETIVPCTCLL